MLSKQKRLSTPLFKKTVLEGKSFHSPSLSLKVLEYKGNEKSRFAAAVSKKVFKSAVDRNTNRRRIYSVIEKAYPYIQKGKLGIFFAKDAIKKASFNALYEEVIFLLKKSGSMIE